MSKEVAVRKPTTLQVQIAMLDAWGYSPTETSKMLDCTREHVHAVRKKDWYEAERQKWVSGGLVQLEGVLESLKVRALSVHGEALEELQTALTAADSDGNPLWDVRLKAIQIALNHRLIQAVTGAVDEGKSITAAVTQVTLNVWRDAEGEPIVIQPEHDDIDGTAVEV